MIRLSIPTGVTENPSTTLRDRMAIHPHSPHHHETPTPAPNYRDLSKLANPYLRNTTTLQPLVGSHYVVNGGLYPPPWPTQSDLKCRPFVKHSPNMGPWNPEYGCANPALHAKLLWYTNDIAAQFQSGPLHRGGAREKPWIFMHACDQFRMSQPSVFIITTNGHDTFGYTRP